jgi:hypothetical protein
MMGMESVPETLYILNHVMRLEDRETVNAVLVSSIKSTSPAYRNLSNFTTVTGLDDEYTACFYARWRYFPEKPFLKLLHQKLFRLLKQPVARGFLSCRVELAQNRHVFPTDRNLTAGRRRLFTSTTRTLSWSEWEQPRRLRPGGL